MQISAEDRNSVQSTNRVAVQCHSILVYFVVASLVARVDEGVQCHAVRLAVCAEVVPRCDSMCSQCAAKIPTEVFSLDDLEEVE